MIDLLSNINENDTTVKKEIQQDINPVEFSANSKKIDVKLYQFQQKESILSIYIDCVKLKPIKFKPVFNINKTNLCIENNDFKDYFFSKNSILYIDNMEILKYFKDNFKDFKPVFEKNNIKKIKLFKMLFVINDFEDKTNLIEKIYKQFRFEKKCFCCPFFENLQCDIDKNIN